MTFPTEVADHHKADLLQKCIYLVSQFKNKDLALWEKYSAEVKTLKVEDSWDFYHLLLVEYQKLAEKPDLEASTGKATKTVSASKKAVTKVTKKAVAKKAVKKVAKKAVAKKVVKKVAKKAVAKKAVKKVAKKAVAKKAVKKVAKKPAPKKAAKTSKKK